MAGTSVIVVGGGASAVYVAVALRERAEARGLAAPSVTVISAEPAVGRGLAYGRAEPHHRLNSPAGKMSVSAVDDKHFLRWAAEHGMPDITPGVFVPRTFFGEYLVDVYGGLVADGVATTVVGDAVAVQTDDTGAHVTLADGRVLAADAAVLAIGNPPPATWPTGAAVQIDDPWAPGAIARVPSAANVLLIGTGLTMVDVATSLARRDDGIRITATSRHLLVPEAHLQDPTAAAPGPGLAANAVSLSELIHDFRSQVVASRESGTPWQAIVDGIRPRLMDHWVGLSEAERRQFLSHVARRWDTHRHRMAASVRAELDALVDAGTLGYAANVDPTSFDVVVFCTGPAAVTARGWSPLVDHLLDIGRIVEEPIGLGAVATASGELVPADGASDGRLLGIGHVLRGALWETTAIGEVRILANRVADRALDTLSAAVR